MPQLDLLAFTEELVFVFVIFVVYSFYFVRSVYPCLDLTLRVRNLKNNKSIKMKGLYQNQILLLLFISNRYNKLMRFLLDFSKTDNK